jgi:hypothetical protein
MSDISNMAIELGMGTSGFQLVTATTLQSGPFCALQVVSNAVFTSITGEGVSGTWTATTIPAGMVIVGSIDSFQLTSGTVIAYKGKITF